MSSFCTQQQQNSQHQQNSQQTQALHLGVRETCVVTVVIVIIRKHILSLSLVIPTIIITVSSVTCLYLLQSSALLLHHVEIRDVDRC